MSKKLATLLSIILVSAMVLPLSIKTGQSSPERVIPPVVSTDWLNAKLGLANLVILDIRSLDLYNASHIPGAINVPDFMWYANPPFGEDVPWMEMPSEDDLFELIGNAGITSDSLVVVVGATSGPLSPMPLALYATATITRVAITLLYAGVVNVAILDGGYDKWVADGYYTETGIITPTPATYSGAVKSGMVVSKEYVANKLGDAIIVDARDPEVYLGLVQEPWTARLGHIASAINLPTPWLWDINLNVSSGDVIYATYKSYDDLMALAFDTLGSDVLKEVIVYCGVGGYASTMYFVLSEVLGYFDVKMYDGSAQEWTNDPEMPMASPPSRVLPSIVSTNWLQNNLNLMNLVVLDTRSSDLYNARHIPGAVNVPEANWYANPPFGADLPWMEMPPADDLFELIGNAGITNNSLVVIVGSTSGPLTPMPLALYSIAGNTRVAITLLYAGVPNVAILDGGYEKWESEGRPTTTDTTTPTPVTYSGAVKSGMVVSKEYVASKIGVATVVDARDLEVYLGFIQEPWAARPGHIPTARSFPTPWLWSLNLNVSGVDVIYATYKDAEILSDYASSIVGTNKSNEVIVYCGVGGYASTMYFVLSEVLGYFDVKMYDGSAQEWTNDPQKPVVYESLGSECMELQGNYSNLQDDYNELSDDYNELQSNYDELQSDYNELQSNYTSLSNSHEELQDNYNELQSDYDELAKTTMPAYLTYIFIATTIIFALTTVYLGLKARTKKE